jgi:hypothetical protein
VRNSLMTIRCFGCRPQIMPPLCALRLNGICKGGSKRFQRAARFNRSYWQPTPKSIAFVRNNESTVICRLCYEADLIERKKRDSDQSNSKLDADRQAARQASIVAATQPNILAAAPAPAVNIEHVQQTVCQHSSKFFWNTHSWSFALVISGLSTLQNRDHFRWIWSIWRWWAYIVRHLHFDSICQLALVRYVPDLFD